MDKKVYAQVYSLIRTFPQGLKDALKFFSEVGYDGVELIGTNTDGMTQDEFKSYLEELNLDVIVLHATGKPGEVEFAHKVGARYITTDLENLVPTREALLLVCEELNKKGQEYAKQGLKLVVHNHDDEFDWVDGEENQTYIYDFILQHTDPTLVNLEFDIGWAARMGVDCGAFIRKYPGRFPLIHVKDCMEVAKTRAEAEHFPKRIFANGLPRDPKTGVPILTDEIKHAIDESRNWNKALGKGIVDWKDVLSAAEEQGCEAYISEREYYHYPESDGTAKCCAKLDYEFLRNLKLD